MGLQLLHALLLTLLLHAARTKLMFINGVQQTDLTPVKPDEVEALISGLQLFARAAMGPNDGTKVSGRDQKNASIDGRAVSTGHSQTNETLKLSRDVPEVNSSKIPIPIPMRPNGVRPVRGVGSTYDIMDSLQSFLGALQINNSKPNFFITNFAAKHTEGTD